MSKKQLNSRLNTLFSDFKVQSDSLVASNPEASRPDLTPPLQLTRLADVTGWSWEADQEGMYSSLSPEVAQCVGVDPGDFLGNPFLTFRLDPDSSECVNELIRSRSFPSEADILFHHQNGSWINCRFSILSGPNHDPKNKGWHGFVQTTPAQQPLTPAASPKRPAASRTRPSTAPLSMPLLDGSARLPRNTQPLTKAGLESLQSNEVRILPSQPDHPATIAVPVDAGEMGDMLLEVIDDQADRSWDEEERYMVVEVANQLALALENARLYQAAQQELMERKRAEEEIIHRNRDLAMLNNIGQKLTSLTTRSDIYNTLAEMVGQVLDGSNLYICIIDKNRQVLSFPVYREKGENQSVPDRPKGSGIADYIIDSHSSLLVTSGVAARLEELGIRLPEGERMPLSLLAIPILSGTHHIGALVMKNYDLENAPQFDAVHVELLSTAVAQAATALENASLFQQMQDALKAIESRERYQAGVARSAASLSELGSQSLGDVLKYLGQATQANRVYFIQYHEENQGFWTLYEDWTSPLVAYLFDRSKIHTIPLETFADMVSSLRTDGWYAPLVNPSDTPASEFFQSQEIQSCLILSVPGKSMVPNLLILEQIDHPRHWLNDEINVLRVAADAIANTFVREDLLAQLRTNLDETESLYNSSNRLVVANDYQEMLSAVILGVKAPGINRGIMLLFDTDNHNKITSISVHANWYSGFGAAPAPVGTEYPRLVFERSLQTNNQSFIEDINTTVMDDAVRQALSEQKVVSLAILPMWSGKRQIGALLLEGEQKHTFTGRETRTFPPLVDQLTIAVENLRLFEQTQTALAETGLLYNMSSAVAQATDPDEMVAMVVNNVMPRGADRASLILANMNEQGEIQSGEIVSSIDLQGSTQLKGAQFKVEDLPLVRMLSEDALVIEDVDTDPLDPASRSLLKQFGFRSACLSPLRSGGRLIGALVTSALELTKFDPADIRLVRTVANGIAVAIEKQRLLRQAQRRALELQTASEIARDTTSTLSLDVLLGRIVSLLCTRFNYYHASIYLVDESRNYVVVRESTGVAGSELKQRLHKVGVGTHSIVGTVASSGQPLIINDVSISSLYLPNPLMPDTRAEMSLPLKLGNRITGVLDIHAQQANSFTQDDVNVLAILTDQIAIAIENARAYELSQKAIEDMREVDRVKSQFLANMSHELRTPLNSIIGFSRVILKGIDGPINETQNQDLSAIYNSGQHLLSLINDILDLSKIDAGKMELSFSDLNISDMINSAMSTAVGLVKDKAIQLITLIPKDMPSVRADSTRVRQVLINFLSNAAKFTDEGSITVEAKTNSSPDGDPEILITVTDTGPGIAEADQSKLFLPFSQVDDSPTRKTGGTGLGLSICRSLIEMHGGRIGLLSSTVGAGSKFFFTLPLPRLENPQSVETGRNGNVILAIDDDMHVISLYERFLQPQGYQVVPHTDPRTAVEKARELKPFAITLDVMMPETDGWTVMKALKNDPVTRDIPIVVCSILEEEEKGFNLGAADYLVKPFLQEDLVNALNRLNQDGKIHEILVIDDDPEDLRLVQKMIEEDRRFHVNLAEGGTKGLAFLQQQLPDVIILDLFMPDLNGFEVLANLRTNPVYKDIPVIVLTGADLTPEQHQQLTEFGQNMLSKGFIREKELLNTLEAALRKFRPKSDHSL